MEAQTNIDYRTAELDEILTHCWLMLEAGAKRARHPFHTPVVGTIATFGCKMRTVVLRRAIVSQRVLMCHSDRRSAKIAELENNNRLSWLFYDSENKIQIRTEGAALLHLDDDIADEQWSRSSAMSRRCYCSDSAPGTIVSSRTSGLPEEFEIRSPTLAESEAGRKNFVVISCKLDLIDWLHLSAKGHARAKFCWDFNKLEAHWTVP